MAISIIITIMRRVLVMVIRLSIATKMEPTLCYGLLSCSAGRASVFFYTDSFGEQRYGAGKSLPNVGVSICS